ncbi:hypothetical protein N7931_15795 [Catenovulum sp. 2E275]|uniref:pectate lyase family protein n=1 Tax=Catenovulum sp. 2E275 TaxID=2980497 RepID=UPI0021D3A125|nr:hypothetical protein [Catenovulum sp. 2E275]MCU4677097.1 hypothetical protein [Catenovulum sp. 2E275]
MKAFFSGTLQAALCSLLITSQVAFAQAQSLAFPEAKGFGRYTQGGYGGQIYVVDSLADNAQNPAKGSLRYAVEQKGPRIVVFNVSGVIHLQAPLKFNNPYITIAGQTSPGGIVISGNTTGISTDQVIIRYLRFRLGSSVADEDAITARNTRDVIIDHCSFSWGVDETATFYNNYNFTLQNSIISESLNNAGHAKGEHGYGGIWGGAGASFINNVIAHHTSRLPRINGHRLKPTYPQSDSYAELINNVIYNWQDKSTYGGENGRFNLIGNYYKQGPAGGAKRIFEFFPVKVGDNKTQAFIAENYFDQQIKLTQDNSKALKFPKGTTQTEIQSVLQNKPVVPNQQAELAYYQDAVSAKAAFQTLIYQKEVGANRNQSGFYLDSVDERVLAEIKLGQANKGKNGIIDTELDSITSWANYQQDFSQFKAYPDTNQDGISDLWMAKFADKLNQNQPAIQQYINTLGAF